MKNSLLLAAAAAALSLATVQGAASAPQQAKPKPVTNLRPNTTGTESTEAFVGGVVYTDLYQIQAGKIAQEKAQSQAVKDFAKKMVADHTAMSNQMKHIFVATGTKIPTVLGPRGQRMISDLNAATPETFDKLYLNQQVTATSAELTLLSAYAEGGESSDIRPAAANAVPAIKANLAKVNELQNTLK